MLYLNNPEATINIGIYLAQPCSMLLLAAMEAPMKQANEILGYERYRFCYIADTQDEINISRRVSLQVDYSIQEAPAVDILFVASEQWPGSSASQRVPLAGRKFLQHMATHTSTLMVGVQLGSAWLVDAGLLDAEATALHWQDQASFLDRYPRQAVSSRIYLASSRFASCAGQAAMLDFSLYLIEKHDDDELAQQVAEQLCLDRIRPGHEPQRGLPGCAEGETPPRLQQAIQLMEAHTEEPLATEEIARRVNLSRRHLERLFKRHLDSMPARFYLELRLKKARQLLLTSNKSIIQIGLGCGFSSGPHFSSAYKSFFNITPRDERGRKFPASGSMV